MSGQCFADSVKTRISHHKKGGGIPGVVRARRSSARLARMPCSLLRQWGKAALFHERDCGGCGEEKFNPNLTPHTEGSSEKDREFYGKKQL